jgi:hypothetical protein
MNNSKIFDIVSFIDKNPISRISDDYKHKFIQKVKEKFTDEQQHLFICSFFSYLNYNSKNDYVVNLENVWKWMGFSRKDPAKRLLIKYFINDIDYKIIIDEDDDKSNCLISHRTVENCGKLVDDNSDNHTSNKKVGRHTEKILMTINTFKKLCIKSNTTKADEIHNYYITLEEILIEIMNDETDDLKNKLSLKNIELKNTAKLTKEKTLLEKFVAKKCVYIVEIEENNLIKVGSTKNVVKRKKELLQTYGNAIFLDIFESNNFREIEERILNDEMFRKNLYGKSIQGHTSREVVKISDNFNMNQLYQIVNNHLNDIEFLTPAQQLENKKLDIEKQKMEYDLLLKVIDKNLIDDEVKEILKNKISNIAINVSPSIKEEKHNQNYIIPDDIKENITDIKNIIDEYKNKKNYGQKINKIDPNNLNNIIKTYDNMSEIIKENRNFTKGGLNYAIKKNTIYFDYRWARINESVNQTVPKVKTFKITGTICKLNLTQTEIIDTYETKNDLMTELKIGVAKMNTIIKDNKPFDGYYYVLYSMCSKELTDNYKKPINKYVFHNSKKIIQINPMNNEEKIYNSLTSISNEFKVKNETIKKAIENKKMLRGFFWNYC